MFRGKRIKELEKRIEGMSEIINDFENNVFKVTADEFGTIITNKTHTSPSSQSIEVFVTSTNNIMNNNIFEGKEMSFRLKHPRTYR